MSSCIRGGLQHHVVARVQFESGNCGKDLLQIRVPLNIFGKPEGRPFLVTADWHSMPLLVFLCTVFGGLK
jgi:hypothetical protein